MLEIFGFHRMSQTPPQPVDAGLPVGLAGVRGERNLAGMLRSSVQPAQQGAQMLIEVIIAGGASQPAGLLQLRRGEAAGGTSPCALAACTPAAKVRAATTKRSILKVRDPNAPGCDMESANQLEQAAIGARRRRLHIVDSE